MIELLGGEISGLGISVLVYETLIVVATGAIETHLKASTDICKLPDIGTDDHRISVEELKAVANKTRVIVLAPAHVIEIAVSPYRACSKLAHNDRLIGKTESLSASTEFFKNEDGSSTEECLTQAGRDTNRYIDLPI